MKRIVICYDGTWNTVTMPEEVTNVVRVGQAVKKTAKNGVRQIVYYNAGVGSGGPLDRFLGGVFGVGLRSNVKRGLAFLTLNWEEGDEIYIFGFSRGAYSARALAGVITAIGGIPEQTAFDRLEEIWSFYRLTPDLRNDETYQKKHKIKTRVRAPDAKFLIKCLAVWDTVGSYGVPGGLGLGGLARRLTSWTRGFHDNILSEKIEVGLHALAIDESRRAFSPTPWVAEEGAITEGQTMEQVWFAGAHSNVGGGYKQSGLSDLALIWMMARVHEKAGLEFDDDYIARNFWPCAACSLYQSSRGWWVSTLFPYRRDIFPGRRRMTGWFDRKKQKKLMMQVNEKIHWSVIERLGRKAIVDESISENYAPVNLRALGVGKVWCEADRPSTEKHDRVAQKTRGEERLIALCRSKQENERLHKCALFCSLSPDAAGNGTKLDVASLLEVPSPADRQRAQRLHALRKIWDMAEVRSEVPDRTADPKAQARSGRIEQHAAT